MVISASISHRHTAPSFIIPMTGGNTGQTAAVTHFIERLHERFSGIRIRAITPYEDEEFALEILVPAGINIDEVEEFSVHS